MGSARRGRVSVGEVIGVAKQRKIRGELADAARLFTNFILH